MNKEQEIIHELIEALTPLKVNGTSIMLLDTRLKRAFEAAMKHLHHNV